MFGVVDPPRSVVVPEVMVWVRFENSDRECSIYFHAHLQGAPEPTKKPLLTSEQRRLPGVLFESYKTLAHRPEAPASDQTTVATPNPVGRPPLSRQPFLMLGLIKLNRGAEGKDGLCHSEAAWQPIRSGLIVGNNASSGYALSFD